MFDGFRMEFLIVTLLNVAFWIGILALIFLGIRWLIRENAASRGSGNRPTEDMALELLRQRFARGEIDAAEYEERRRTLGC
jgi:putative membrane protein